MARFKDKRNVIATVEAIAKLLASWGLAPDEWMIGKEMAFFFTGIIKDPRLIARDTTVYVLYKKLPWKCNPDMKGRIVFPPAQSLYNKQYQAVQKKLNLGIDLYPVPNNHLKTHFITARVNFIHLNNISINIETPQKFIYRIEKLTDYFGKRSVDKIREFYFADKKRYVARLRLYARIERGLRDEILKHRIVKITEGYKRLMRRAYPELFLQKRMHQVTVNELKGVVAYPSRKNIHGEAFIWKDKRQDISKDKKVIFVFSHFYPADTKVLPFAKAILVEGGGMLSHAAIVCREAKVPCMVGVRGLYENVISGMSLEIDFAKGVLQFHVG